MVRRTKEDALATRDALLDAAERVFGRRGVARTSLAEVAQEAGVTRGAVYWHFKDKVDLFSAMVERVTLPLDASMSQLATVEGDPLRQMQERLNEAVRVIAQDERTQRVLEIGCLMVEHVAEMGSLRDQEVNKQRLSIQVLTQSLEAAAAFHHVALPASAAALAHGLHGMARGLVTNWLLDRTFDLEASTMAAVRTYLRGMGFQVPGASDRPDHDNRR